MKALLVICFLLGCAAAVNLQCQFDKLYQEIKPTPPQKGQGDRINGRLLISVSRSPMRITLDTTSFNTLNPGVGSTPTTTLANLAFVLKSMTTTQYFYMSRLKVLPMPKITAPVSCVDMSPPSNDVSNGVSNSDLHIYVLYTTDSTKGYGATGKSCAWYSGSLPDVNLQTGRPIVGRIIMNTYSLVDGMTLTNRLFQSITSTAIHETTHILGFDSTMYGSYLDQNTGNVYSYPVTVSGSGTININRPATTYLVTPAVKAWAVAFFNCPSAPGMQLENEDATGLGSGSHWERLMMYDELMTGTAFGAQKGMSGLTFALLKDTGWYTVDDTFNQTTNYGYQLGCSFFYNACYGTSFNSYFCNAATQATTSSCQTNFYGKSVCSNQAGIMADGCGVFGPYFNCVDPASSDDGYQSYTFEVYGTSSFCIGSTLSNVPLSSTLQSRCYPYQCLTSSIVFTIGTYSITCLSTEAGIQKTLSALTGSLTCPVFADFCTNSRKTCPNWCSQNGYCMGGICNCNPGYSGSDCSKVVCNSTAYYNPANNLCVLTCPTQTYASKYDKSCLPCSPICSQCRDQPQICTSCISTPLAPQYFYNGVCYSTCPSDTYLNLDTCYACDVASNCQTCAYSPVNCTSCLGGLFLSTPTNGACVASCSGTYNHKDLVNFLCVSTCDNNLVLSGSDCDLCPLGSFKYIANASCLGSCPNLYYADSTLRMCKGCDGSCLTCNGQYAQNCTSCNPSSPNMFILLSMCLSICPKGFYQNASAGACQLCTIGLNCASCSLSAGQVICVTCLYGSYFANGACTSSCAPYYYKNSWNNSCSACSSSCGNCNGPSATNCLDCPATYFFLSNVTGGYCVKPCPTIGYVTSGSNCLSCDSTCLTCNGVSSSSCVSCVSGYYLSNGYCRYVCPSGFYPNSIGQVCSPCNGLCTFCFGNTQDNCSACVTGKVLYNFTCMAACPNGLSVNQWNVCYEGSLKIFTSVLLLLILLSA